MGTSDFEIGREIGELRARLDQLEKSHTPAPSGSRAIPDYALSKEQRAALEFLRQHYRRLIEVVNEELVRLDIEGILGRKLFARGINFGPAPVADNICCICCTGDHYCCDDQRCATCCK